MQIGEWAGQEVPIDEATVRATDTDAHINRRYTRQGAPESVNLYVACGVKARDLMPHRPEVCYTGSGWTLLDRHSVELALSDGTKLPCNVMQFSKGGLNAQKVLVLDYYLVDRQYCSDVSLLRSKAWRGSGTVKYVAQVQVITPVMATMTSDSAMRLVSAFAVDSAASITGLFENEEKNPTSE
jgi:EpsI family protein